MMLCFSMAIFLGNLILPEGISQMSLLVRIAFVGGLHLVTPPDFRCAHQANQGAFWYARNCNVCQDVCGPLSHSPLQGYWQAADDLGLDDVGTTGGGGGSVQLIITKLARFGKEKWGDRVTTIADMAG